jgi:hypothetical protein
MSETSKCQTWLTSRFSGVLVELRLDRHAPALTVLLYYHRIVHFDDDGWKRMCYAEASAEKGRCMMSELQASGTARAVPVRIGQIRGWQHWAPYAAVVWSLVYAALGVYWFVSGRGFPYTPDAVSDVTGPVVERFGPGVAWTVVILAGVPAAALGAAMLRGVRSRALRPLFISA